ncbi:MAG: hypothetical protein V1827_02260 [Candidatus Micrarchaeota archaeon]
MSRITVILALALMLSIPLSSAGSCEDACQADYDRWAGVADDNLAAKAYYCGISSTNCWSRNSVPSGQSDPCWAMCYQDPFNDDAFQSCCHASAVENSQGTLDQCLAACVPEPPPATDGAGVKYNVQISSSGQVTITDMDGDAVSGISDTPVSIRTGSDGYLYLDFMASGGKRTMRVKIYPDTGFNFDGSSCAVAGGASAGLSSEHGSCRGTINGGGDFIKGKDGSVAYLSDSKQVRLAASGDSGRVDIEEDTASGEPGFELSVALPDGMITIKAPNGRSTYSAEISDGKVKVSVGSGDIALSSSAGGYGRSLTAGNTALLSATDMSAPLIEEDGGEAGDIAPPPAPECEDSLDCPGTEVCEDGACVEAKGCGSAAILLLFGLAAFASKR